MAEKLSEYVDSRAVPITYPNGQLVDESAPGANDGTLLRQVHIQDMWNVFSRLMGDAGLTFDTNPDTEPSSQFYEALSSMGPSVGTLEQSFLTEAQFLAQPGRTGGTWVRCDGQNVAGSKYETITGLSTVPDLTGRFLRDSTGSDAGIKTTQANQMGAHTHSLSDNGAAKITLGSASPSQFDASYDLVTGLSSYTTLNHNLTSLPSVATTPIPSTSGTGLSGSTDGIVSQTTETRPDSIIVNTFIKIN